MCEHKIQILCQRLKITLGSKKQQLSQPFHAEMNTNLRNKKGAVKENAQCKSKPEVYIKKFYFEWRDRLGSEKDMEIKTRDWN